MATQAHKDTYALAFALWQTYNRRDMIYKEDEDEVSLIWRLIDKGHSMKAFDDEDEEFDDVYEVEDEEQSLDDVARDAYYLGIKGK
jgi:hypothetical protein